MSDYNNPSNFFSPSDSDIDTPSDSDYNTPSDPSPNLTPAIDYLGPSSARFSDVPTQYPNPARNRPPPDLPGYHNQIVPSIVPSPPTFNIITPSISPTFNIITPSPSITPTLAIITPSPNIIPSMSNNTNSSSNNTNSTSNNSSTVTYTTVNTDQKYPSHPPTNSVWCCFCVFLFFMFGGGVALTFSPFSRMEGGKKEFFDYGE